MPPATNEEQFRFLISCIRWSSNGRVDFQEVANECGVVSKGAAAKRYERMMRAHGIHPNGGPINPPSGSSGPIPRARQPKAARDGSDRYSKGKSKADKAKQKQAQFDEDRDADMDDEEPDYQGSDGVKDEVLDDNAEGSDRLDVVKDEHDDESNELDRYEDGGEQSVAGTRSSYAGNISGAQRHGSPAPVTPKLVYSADSPSFAAQFGGGGFNPSRPESAYWSRTTPKSVDAYGVASPPNSNPPSTTLPQNGFDFNAYAPRAGTPASFFGNSGVRTPEEVHSDQEMDGSPKMGKVMPKTDGPSSPRPAVRAQSEAEVISID